MLVNIILCLKISFEIEILKIKSVKCLHDYTNSSIFMLKCKRNVGIFVNCFGLKKLYKQIFKFIFWLFYFLKLQFIRLICNFLLDIRLN